jgi:uncharacterized protein Yka (UPF0111/DUF47 family)
MSPTVGLERLPHATGALLEEARANLLAIANELDVLVKHGSRNTLTAIALREEDGDRITHDLIHAARTNHRAGPDRSRLVARAQAIDDVVDAIDDLAWTWSRQPLPFLTDLLLRVREAARAAAAIAYGVEDDDRRSEALQRAAETIDAAREADHAARAWLLVEQPDPGVAIAGHALVTRANRCIRSCARLRACVERDAVTG